MRQTGHEKNQASPFGAFLVFGVFALFSILTGESVALLVPIIAIAVIGTVVGILAKSLLLKAKDTPRAGAAHSHDRIDHSTDLKLNPQTGKVEGSIHKAAASHSQQEHWKQQLDGLLANGTIDRREYNAMLNRKF